MSKFEFASVEGSPKPERPTRLSWVTPVIVKINAGSAENGFSTSRDDGVFTKS
jgi:hypothetical protein